MGNYPPLPPEPTRSSSKRFPGGASSQSSVSSQGETPPLDDLIKNQWIPFASTAVFFLLTACFVYIVGGFAIRLAEPTINATSVPTSNPQSTNTLSPTLTSIPTPTVAFVTPIPITLRVLPITANVRAIPSTTAKIVGQIRKDTLATPLARSEDGRWLLIVSFENGITGWVASELFEIVRGDPKTIPTVAPATPQSLHQIDGWQNNQALVHCPCQVIRGLGQLSAQLLMNTRRARA